MEALTHHWRPADRIRAKALGLHFRDGKLLVAEVHRDNGTRTGWRPLGGSIEFGEQAEHALRREFREELGAEIAMLVHLGTFENIFTHHGTTGHEIIFAFEVALTVPGLAAEEDFTVSDEGVTFRATWIALDEFRNGRETLFPAGLLPLVPANRAP